jgi:hypothetical protein
MRSGRGFTISAMRRAATSSSNFVPPEAIRGPQLAAELVALSVDVIVSEGPVAPDAVDPSGHVPIVSATLVEPVQRGFAVSLAHPGRNIPASP